ncbi:MAG TPA: helix-turn-helix domain-containing protein [Pseudonocardiaceae bacterium]
MFVIRPTVPVLRPYVDSIWLYGSPSRGVERVLPDGAQQLLVNLDADELGVYGPGAPCLVGGAAVQAAHAGAVLIERAHQRRIAGVSFRPGGAHPFLGAPSCALDPLVELGELWGREGAVLRERLLTVDAHGGPAGVLRALESALLARLRDATPDPALGYAVRVLSAGAPVHEVATGLGVGRRAFGSRFAERVGLTPKRFARVRRLQRVLRAVDGGTAADWARVAAEHGYYDQSHLIHDFRALAGLRPTEYRPRSADERNHVPISPSEAAATGLTMAS